MGSCQSSESSNDVVVGTSAPNSQKKVALTKTQQKDSFHSAATAGTASGSADSRSAAAVSSAMANVVSEKLSHARVHSSIGLDDMVKERKSEGHLVSNMVHIEKLSGRKITEVYDGVHDGRELGKGVAGVVRLVTHKQTGTQFAVKCLELSRAISSVESQQALREEINIMSQLDHPNIARLQEVYEDHEQIYLVQELGSGGELFDVLDKQPDYHYGEAEAVELMLQILSALRYLHSKGIIHRDLKLENFLFSTNRLKQLKMIDFGLSKHFNTGEVQHESVGTPYTVAPEVIKGQYDEKCDIWAIGVISYMLLSGETPFGGCGDDVPLKELRQNILECRYEFEPADVWDTVTPEARDFVQKMLALNPANRPTAEGALKHPWIRAFHQRTTEGATLSPKIIKDLLAFKDLPVMKRFMLEVVSFATRPEQIRDLRMEYEKMDTDGLGEISAKCMIEVLMRGSSESCEISEAQILEIFNAMKVGKSESRVHWHEFVAACLPECQVDDRNLKIAFDRLDQDHSGFITYNDVIEIVARDADEDEYALQSAWEESVEEYHCQKSQFSFEDFCHLVNQSV